MDIQCQHCWTNKHAHCTCVFPMGGLFSYSPPSHTHAQPPPQPRHPARNAHRSSMHSLAKLTGVPFKSAAALSCGQVPDSACEGHTHTHTRTGTTAGQQGAHKEATAQPGIGQGAPRPGVWLPTPLETMLSPA